MIVKITKLNQMLSSTITIILWFDIIVVWKESFMLMEAQ